MYHPGHKLVGEGSKVFHPGTRLTGKEGESPQEEGGGIYHPGHKAQPGKDGHISSVGRASLCVFPVYTVPMSSEVLRLLQATLQGSKACNWLDNMLFEKRCGMMSICKAVHRISVVMLVAASPLMYHLKVSDK